MQTTPLPMEDEQPQPLAAVNEVETKPLDKGLLSAITDQTMLQQAQKMVIEEQHFELSQRRAMMFSLSGLFQDPKLAPGSKQAVAQAMVRIELGESMGFSAAESLQGIYIINGVTAISSALRAGRMQAAGYDWLIQWHGTHTACKGCTIWLSKNGDPLRTPQPQVWTHAEPPAFPLIGQDGKPIKTAEGKFLVDQVNESFLESDARAMMTTIWEGPKGNRQPRRTSILEKDNWKYNPRNMYFARAITNTQRFYAPKVLSVSLMSAEEASDLDSVAEETTARYGDSIPSGGSREAQAMAASEALERLRQQGKAEHVEPTGSVATTAPEVSTNAPQERQDPQSPEAPPKSREELQLEALQKYAVRLPEGAMASLLKRLKFSSIQEAAMTDHDTFTQLSMEIEDKLHEGKQQSSMFRKGGK